MMTYYAQYDTNAESYPTRVTAFYDTDLHEYPNLDTSVLVELTDEQKLDVYADPMLWAIDADKQLVKLDPPPPSPYQVYAEHIAQGIAITSTDNPALNATYPLDTESVALVGSIARDASAGLGLPNDAATVGVKDIDGNPHDASETELILIYKAERDLIQKLNQQRDIAVSGGTPNWPPQSATIGKH